MAKRAAWCRRALVAGFFLALIGATIPALSHPLGNFSIDHYSRLRVTPQALRLRYIIDMAEIPILQEVLQADTDGDRDVSVVERRAYLERAVRDLTARLAATLNGNPLVWRIEYSNLTGLSNTGAPTIGPVSPTLRIFMDMRAEFPAPLSSENTVRYEDRNYPERTGWKEIIVEAEPGVRLLNSSASRKDVSNELTRFPPQVLAPPQDVAATFTFATGPGAGLIGTVRAKFRHHFYLWLMGAVAAVGLLVRWRISRRARG